MFRKSIITLLFLFVLGITTYAQEECTKYSIPSLGISFCTPTDWVIEKRPTGYDYVVGKERNGFTPNMNVRSGDFPGAVSKVADSGIEEVLKMKAEGMSGVVLDSRSDFSAGNQSGVKAVFKIVFNKTELKSIQYFFSGKADTKIVITAMTLWSDSEKLERRIDDSMKTFTVDK